MPLLLCKSKPKYQKTRVPGHFRSYFRGYTLIYHLQQPLFVRHKIQNRRVPIHSLLLDMNQLGNYWGCFPDARR